MVEFRDISSDRNQKKGRSFLDKLASVPGAPVRRDTDASAEEHARGSTFLTLLSRMPSVGDEAPAAQAPAPRTPRPAPAKAPPEPAPEPPPASGQDHDRAREIDDQLSSIFGEEEDDAQAPGPGPAPEGWTPAPAAAPGPDPAPAPPAPSPAASTAKGEAPSDVNHQLAGIFAAKGEAKEKPPKDEETRSYDESPPPGPGNGDPEARPDEPMYGQAPGKGSLQNFVSKIMTELDTILGDEEEAPGPPVMPPRARADETVDEGSE